MPHSAKVAAATAKKSWARANRLAELTDHDRATNELAYMIEVLGHICDSPSTPPRRQRISKAVARI